MDGAVVRLVETPDGHPIVIPRLTADPNHGGSVTAEAAGINELDATLSSVTLATFKYGITQLVSQELFDDEVIDLEQTYGGQNQGAEDQASVHQGRWRTTDAIMAAWEDRVAAAVEEALGRLVGAYCRPTQHLRPRC